MTTQTQDDETPNETEKEKKRAQEILRLRTLLAERTGNNSGVVKVIDIIFRFHCIFCHEMIFFSVHQGQGKSISVLLKK